MLLDMKIGIMGGTFDPIHKGHLKLGECAYQAYGLDKIWFMPNGNPPHKSNQLMETNIQHRIEMVRCAIESTSYFELSLLEVDSSSISYSYATMEYLNQLYPETSFYFILGADSLFAIEKWECPQRLFRTCTLLAAVRNDKSVEEMECQIQYLERKYHAAIELLLIPLMKESSSSIRAMIRKQHPVNKMLPDKVSNYIEAHKLYKDRE